VYFLTLTNGQTKIKIQQIKDDEMTGIRIIVLGFDLLYFAFLPKHNIQFQGE
jgi:hypothetical protein